MRELPVIAEAIGLDYWNIHDRERDARTPTLEVIKREIVRGEVVGQYTIIDDLLATKMCEYFYPSRSLLKLWKTRRFKRFNFYVLERLYMLHKLALVKDVYHVPKAISSTIEGINSLRNAMAHAFFPENLRVYQAKGRAGPRKPVRVLYKGEDIFSRAGVEKFVKDCGEVTVFLVLQMKRKRRGSKTRAQPPTQHSVGLNSV